MSRIELPEPCPRGTELPPPEERAVPLNFVPLDAGAVRIERGFSDVVLFRECRVAQAPLRVSQFASLAYYSVHTKAMWRSPAGAVLRHKPVPSSGARHPVELVLVGLAGMAEVAFRYDGDTHSLVPIESEAAVVREALDKAQRCSAGNRGSLLLLAADFRATEAAYENPESLVWRDAGTVLGHLCLVAEALELACTPLGMTGDPEVRALLRGTAGVGALYVGNDASV